MITLFFIWFAMLNITNRRQHSFTVFVIWSISLGLSSSRIRCNLILTKLSFKIYTNILPKFAVKYQFSTLSEFHPKSFRLTLEKLENELLLHLSRVPFSFFLFLLDTSISILAPPIFFQKI